jgi:two-component system, response regulator PdtaR
MSRQCRLAIADEDGLARRRLHDQLTQLGRQVVVDAANGEQLIDGINQLRPDLIVADAALINLDAALRLVAQQRRLPMVVVADRISEATLAQLLNLNVFGCLLKPARSEELNATIIIALERHDELDKLRQELDDARRDLDDRKTIERAKGMLMKHLRVDEEQAYEKMRRAARMNRQKLIDVARSMLLTGALLDDEESHDR